MARPARSRRRNGVRGKQGRVEPQDRHRRGQPQPPDRCAATSWAVTAASAGNRRASPAVTASSTARQSPPGDPAGTSTRAAGSASGSSRVSCSRSTPARAANRDRHDLAVDAGTCRRPPPGTASQGRAAARPAAAACAASTSTAMITAAPYRRRDHRSAGKSTCVRPQPPAPAPPRPELLQPGGTATSRRRACPHGASTPPQHGQRSAPAASRDSTLSAEPRTVTTRCHLRHRQAALPEVHSQKITGRAAATAYMATVTPSTNPRIANPPDHTKTTPSTARTPAPVATLNGAGHPPARSARPASTVLSRTASPAISAPAFPAALVPGNRAGRAAHTGMHARLGGARQARNTPPARPVRGRPWKADGAHRPSWRHGPVRYASVDTATQRSTARQGDTRRDREETAR